MPQLDILTFYYVVPSTLILYFIASIFCVFYGMRPSFFQTKTITMYVYKIFFKLKLIFKAFSLLLSTRAKKKKSQRGLETVWQRPAMAKGEIYSKVSNFTWLKYVPRKPAGWKPR